jgi:hypothetical protein
MISLFAIFCFLVFPPSFTEEKDPKIASLYPSLHQDQEFLSYFSSIFPKGRVLLISEGTAAAYTLYNLENEPCFIIKPTDECMFCLNNPKSHAFICKEPQNYIPLYRSAQTEAFCYELAKMCKLEHVTPKTALAFLAHPNFSYSDPNLAEKLCSIQEYLKDTFSLRKILQEFFRLGLSEEEIRNHFDQESFEDLILFLWMIADTDAHVENFRVYLKKNSPSDRPIYGLKKIDNSLSFPEKTLPFSHALMYFPNAVLPISDRIRVHVQSLPIAKIQALMQSFHLEDAYEAFEKRMTALQKILEKKDITYYECSLQLVLLGTNEDKHLIKPHRRDYRP